MRGEQTRLAGSRDPRNRVALPGPSNDPDAACLTCSPPTSRSICLKSHRSCIAAPSRGRARIFGGRFPIDIWPRPLMWAFEWHDMPERELRFARGEPLFDCQFETVPQDRPVQHRGGGAHAGIRLALPGVLGLNDVRPGLLPSRRTRTEKPAYLEHISGVVNFVNQTFSLFRTAEERRPKTLLVPRAR